MTHPPQPTERFAQHSRLAELVTALGYRRYPLFLTGSWTRNRRFPAPGTTVASRDGDLVAYDTGEVVEHALRQAFRVIHCHRAEVIAVTEPHNWPFEQPAEGTLRPWYLTATGHLMVLFRWTTPAPAAPPSGWLPPPGTVSITWSGCWPTTTIRPCATTANPAWPTCSGMTADTIPS